MSNDVRPWVMQVIPQVAAMDGETNILGDSKAERSIMEAMLKQANQEEKDLIQKFLDGEKISNPQERNKNKIVKYDLKDCQDPYKKYVPRENNNAVCRETLYDEQGNFLYDWVLYDDKSSIVNYNRDEILSPTRTEREKLFKRYHKGYWKEAIKRCWQIMTFNSGYKEKLEHERFYSPMFNAAIIR